MDNDNGKSLECLENPEITKMEEESCENEYGYRTLSINLKWTVSVISSDSPSPMAIPDLQRYPCNLYLINKLEYIVVFLGQPIRSSRLGSYS